MGFLSFSLDFYLGLKEEDKMRTNEVNPAVNKVLASSALSTSLVSTEVSYHELSEVPVREVDLLEQLQSNMAQLQDLHSRMSFVMKEVRYLLKV